MQNFEEFMRQGGAAALSEAGQFFMKTDPVHQTLRAITERLDSLKIPYAVAGGMALVAHGYDRTTVDVDILLTPSGLAAVHEHLDGLGYVAPFQGSKNLRDVETGVRIEFLVAGSYPGDGKPKPVAFPEPASVGVKKDGILYLGLGTLVELKLASGMTAAHRLKDLADVLELIKALGLSREMSNDLNPFVRDKYLELWDAAQTAPQDQP